MIPPALILALMLMLVPAEAQKHNGESAEAAQARYGVIADAIAAEARDDLRLSRFLVTIARHETTFRQVMHSGEKKGDHGTSWGLYQIKCGHKPDSKVWNLKIKCRDLVGVSPKATAVATKAAATFLRPIIERCYGAPICVFKAYGGIPQDRLTTGTLRKRLLARAATYRRLVRQ